MAPSTRPAAAYRHLLARLGSLSLRARLLLGLLLVASVGLVSADVVVYNEISSYLNAQVTAELQAGASTLIGRGNRLAEGPLPLGIAAQVLLFSGTSYSANPSGFRLRLPAGELARLTNAAEHGENGAFVTFNATGTTGGSPGDYRVLPEPAEAVFAPGFAGQVNAVAFIAIPLFSLEGTLHELLVIDLVATLAILTLLGFLGYAVVRVGMRPLESIEVTAAAIANGDLTRRVEFDDPATEVGRLGAALNVMLSGIEHAFSEQQASEERLRQFLADSSHELRTPVTSIRGYAELFRRGAASRPEDLARAMQRIEEEARRMGLLVDDLLLLARLDQGRPLERRPLDFSLPVTDAAADAQALAPGREITVELEAPLYVVGDDLRLYQVVANLLQNALRYSPEGSPIAVTLRREGAFAVLRVRDEGEGIASEHLPHLFERFYRADPARSRDRGGSGLGLAIVASIVEAHGGSVRVESRLGAGATFVVTLPLVEIPAEGGASWAHDGGAQPRSESEAGLPGPE